MMLLDVNPPTTQPTPTPPSPPSGPMTRARAKALHDKVNSLLTSLDLGSTLDGILLHADTLCILRYEPPKTWEDEATRWSKQGEASAGNQASAVLPPGPAVVPPRSSASGTTGATTGLLPITTLPTRGTPTPTITGTTAKELAVLPPPPKTAPAATSSPRRLQEAPDRYYHWPQR